MLSSQGPAQDPNFIPVLIALAIVLIVWWRIVLIIGRGALRHKESHRQRDAEEARQF